MSFPRVLILAGGFGTRLSQVVKDVPKPMAPVADRPFLEYQIEFLRKQGFRQFTLLTGYLSEVIERHFGDGSAFGVEISYSVETEPLGTGGAIRMAMEASRDDAFVVLNGDSMFATDIARFVQHSVAPVSIALNYTSDLSRYGSVQIDSAQTVTKFAEKSDSAVEGYINAGIYFITRSALELMPRGKFSFETEVMQPLGSQGKLKGIPCGGLFVDIGTPESFHWSHDHLPAWLEQKWKPCLFLDRDGVIVEHVNYLHKIEDAVLVPETLEFARYAKERGWWVVVVTNQSGVGRGIFTEEQCLRLNAYLDQEMTAAGAKPDAWECSYDHPVEGRGEFKRDSLRRKPKPGMLLKACDVLPIDISRSLMIGDNSTDQIELPGLRTILVQGDYELKNIRLGNRTAANFAELRALVKATVDHHHT